MNEQIDTSPAAPVEPSGQAEASTIGASAPEQQQSPDLVSQVEQQATTPDGFDANKAWTNLRGAYTQTTQELSELKNQMTQMQELQNQAQSAIEFQQRMQQAFQGKVEPSEQDLFYQDPLQATHKLAEKYAQEMVSPMQERLNALEQQAYVSSVTNEILTTRQKASEQYTEEAVLAVENSIKQMVDPSTGQVMSQNGRPYYENLIDALGYQAVFDSAIGSRVNSRDEVLMKGLQDTMQQRRAQKENLFVAGNVNGGPGVVDTGIVSHETVFE